VGKLRQELRRLKIEDNTIVWFVSDNGGIREGSGGRLKGKIGVRTLGLLEWPAKIPKPMISDIPVSHVDMYPTVLDIAGVTLEHQPVIDGVSLMSLFEGRMRERPKPLGFTNGGKSMGRSEFIHGNGVWIDGSYKMRQTRSNKNKAEQVTLHDVILDPKELNDLSAKDPSRVEKMLNDLNTWRKSVKNSYFGKDYE
jgi:arylsulfatase A-like enzyme